MKKGINIILIGGLLLVIFSFIPSITTYAEANHENKPVSERNDHIKLFEVMSDFLTMRTAPEEGADIIGHLVKGNKLRTFEKHNGWMKTFYDGKPVWVVSDYLLLLEVNNQQQIEDEPEINDTTTQDGTQNKSMKKETNGQANNSLYLKENIPNQFFISHATRNQMELPRGFFQPKQVQISEKSIQVKPNKLAGFQIVIDAGHGGEDAGAISDHIFEKDITLSTTRKVAAMLSQSGAKVSLTRKNDTFISLANRVNMSNKQNTDVFISLHYDYFDDPEANGVHTYFYNDQTSENLANTIQNTLMKKIDMTDRGVDKADYYVLAHNAKPSVLVELGFMTNPGDLEIVQSEDYQEAIAQAITDGVAEYLEQEQEP